MSCVSAHVSACPNHQTLRVTPLESRFAVASFGVLGYECNLCDMSKEDLESIKAQIALYKEYRNVWQFGDFYRVESGNHYQWNVVSQDKKDGYRYDHAKRSAAKYHVQEISGKRIEIRQRPIILSGCRASIISRNLAIWSIRQRRFM